MNEVDKALVALVKQGLQMQVDDLSRNEQARQRRALGELVKEYGAASVVRAIRHGMPGVWPFSDGRAFDAIDLRDNFLKARAEAARMVREGRVPTRIRFKGDA